MRAFVLIALLCLALAGCGAPGLHEADEPAATSCGQIVDGCSARRLEDVVLRGSATDGALGPIDGLDASGLIGFDRALESAWTNDFRGTATTVQVVLGSADAAELHWGTGRRLYYAVEWGGVCAPIRGPLNRASAPGPPDCGDTHATVIEAHTGAFVVSGG